MSSIFDPRGFLSYVHVGQDTEVKKVKAERPVGHDATILYMVNNATQFERGLSWIKSIGPLAANIFMISDRKGHFSILWKTNTSPDVIEWALGGSLSGTEIPDGDWWSVTNYNRL